MKQKPAKNTSEPLQLTYAQKLDAVGIDQVCEWIDAQDMSYQDIADNLGIWKSQLVSWIAADSDRSARVKLSRESSAQTNDNLALAVIKSLPADATPAQIAAMREEVQHRRWRASKRNPREYGDKITNEHTGVDGGPMIVEVVRFGKD